MKYLLISMVLIIIAFFGCDVTDPHSSCPGHNGHFHNSEINHNHSSSYNTPCQQSHGHCH